MALRSIKPLVRSAALLALWWTSAACSLPLPDPAALASAADGSRDAGLDLLGGIDAVTDAAKRDMPTADDTGSSDGPLPPCAARVDADTVALYTFDGAGAAGVMRDLSGNHDGSLVGGQLGQEFGRPAGKTGCGRALSSTVAYAGKHHALVPNHSDFKLKVGSIDAWVRFDAKASRSTFAGIISRDAKFMAKPGHLMILRACNGSIVLRLQEGSGKEAVICSPPIAFDRWYHVAANFGGGKAPELYVDGVAAKHTGSVPVNDCASKVTCGVDTTGGLGIAGNDNPWVFGAANDISAEGSATPVHAQMGGALDSVRISRVRRAWAKASSAGDGGVGDGATKP